jgi:Flp pilus assembly protein TadD
VDCAVRNLCDRRSQLLPFQSRTHHRSQRGLSYVGTFRRVSFGATGSLTRRRIAFTDSTFSRRMPTELIQTSLNRIGPRAGDRRHLRIALWIFLTFSVLYIGLTRGRFQSTDEIGVYQATQSLWERGTAAIRSPEGVRGRGGQRFAVVNSGLSVAALPLYGIGKAVDTVSKMAGREDWSKVFAGPVIERAGGDRWGGEPEIFFVKLFNCFATALLCALFYCFSLEIGASTKWALLSTALLGLTTYVAPFSAGFFQHSSEALFLLAAFYFLFLDGQRADWRWRLLAGLATLLLLQFRYPAIMAVPSLLLYHGFLVWRRRPKGTIGATALATLRQVAPFIGALVLALVLHALDQFAKFGTIWSVGNYASLRNHNPLLLGLYGFLFSPGDSIFLFTPLLVLAPWTLRNLYRRFPAEVIFILTQTGVYLFFYGKFDDWHGLWCFGPRYLMALVPLLMLPLGPWLEGAGRKYWLILVPLALTGLWMQAIHFAVDFWEVALRENYPAFKPPHGFLFIPTASQIVAHSKALLAWDSRVNMWLVTVYRIQGPGAFFLLFLPLALLLAGCIRQLQRSVRALKPGTATDHARRGSNRHAITAPVIGFRRLAAGFLLAALLFAYGNHFYNSFHFDDAHTIQNNAAIRQLGNIPQFFRDATTFSSLPSNQSYRPLVSTLLAIDYWLGKDLWPFWFHLSIFALLFALVLLLAFVIYRLLETSRPSPSNRWIALLAAAAYGVHPANSDTVNYIIASGDVISTLGIVASFAVYLAFPAWRRSFLFVLPAAFCILAKPPAAVFAVLFARYRWLFPSPREDLKGTRILTRILAWACEAGPPLLICAATLAFVQHMTPRTWVAGATSAHDYLLTQPYVIWQYIRTFLWPSALSADYDLNPLTTTSDARFWIGFGFTLLFAVSAVAFSIFKRTRLIGFGLLWFLIGLLPTSLFPLAEVMNDHRTFLPYLGLMIALAGLASLVLQRFPPASPFAKTFVAAAVALVLGGSAYATLQRNKVWYDEETLWRDVTLKSPRNGRGLMNYGLTLMAKGDYKGALDYFRRAEVFTPQYSFLFINFAIAEDATGQTALAEQHFQEALRLAPSLPDAYSFYARFLRAHSRQAEAEPLLQKAAELSPADQTVRDLRAQPLQFSAESYLNLSLQRYREGRFPEAIAASQKALELRPNYPEAWNNIGAAYNNMGQFEKAVAACETALRLKPDFPLARNNLNFAREQIAAKRSN